MGPGHNSVDAGSSRVTCVEIDGRARAAGVVITTEPNDFVIQSIPEPTPLRYAFCKGPDGEIIEFFQNTTT
jgi:glyoxylase I family protein